MSTEKSTRLFGTLIFNEDLDWFTGESLWIEESVEVSFHVDQNNNIDAGLKVAETLWQHQDSWKERIEDYAVQELLMLKNENWLEEGQDTITPVEFKKLMKLQSIVFYPDGDFNFWYDDGDLFWGHSIAISGNLEGLKDADIPG